MGEVVVGPVPLGLTRPSGEEGDMRARRDVIRAVVPPLLALGLVALLVRPVDSVPQPVAPPSVATQTTSVPAHP